MELGNKPGILTIGANVEGHNAIMPDYISRSTTVRPRGSRCKARKEGSEDEDEDVHTLPDGIAAAARISLEMAAAAAFDVHV